MEPIENLQENICSQHNQVESVFCQTCQKCICNLCQLDEHTGHNTVPADITKRQTELQTKQHTAQQRVRSLEKNIDLLNQELRAINQSADKVVSETENKLRKLIEQKSRNLTEKIKKQQQLEVSRVQGLLKKLQEELAVERERNAELKEVATIKSYTEFLQRCSSVSAKWTHHNPPNIPVIPDRPSPLMYFEQVSMAVSELNRTCIKDFKKLVQAVTEVDVLLPPNPQSNEEFLHYSFQLTLNPNTANKTLVLSEKNTKVSSMKEEQHYPPHPDRFMDKAQVLSMNPLPPRCYWEVEWTGLSFYVGVAYKDIKREGPKSAFGSNDNCWVLECQNKRNYVFKHNGEMQVSVAL
ncbi:hypothetical protein NQD34_008671 [Periophthalmus magnuspinnatus]|nr:hypothetical protein NQD34_008671 [Periophthalmus magnuspinnatus]